MTALAPARTWSIRTSFWLVVATQVLFLAGSNFPTPLFPVYARRYGFSSGVVTLLFAAYVVALVPSLLSLGRLTDRVGRRPALVAGIAVTALSSVAFAAARSVGWLFAGEIVYGIAGGMIMSAASVAIRELHPAGDVARGSLAATVAFSSGLTLGPLVSGVLATVAPWPTVTPYALDIAFASLLAVALLRIPETRPDRPRPAQRPPVLHVPADIRSRFAPVALAGATPWMATGWVFGLSPSFLHEQLGVDITQPVVAGLFSALMVASNGVAQLVFRRHHDAEPALRVALTVMVGGIALIAASTLVGGLPLALAGAVLAGAGAGVVQMATMSRVQAMAPDHARAGVTSAFLTAGYVALSVPVVIAGLSADRIGLGPVTGWYLVALVALVAVALVGLRRREEAVVVPECCERPPPRHPAVEDADEAVGEGWSICHRSAASEHAGRLAILLPSAVISDRANASVRPLCPTSAAASSH